MGVIVKPNTFSAGATILAAEHNDNFDTVYECVNGNIDNANIKAAAGIVDTKLAQITTAQKVHGSSLTGLGSINTATAGFIPGANIDTGTTAGKVIALDSSARLPAVDGRNLTNITTSAGSVVNFAYASTSSVLTGTTAMVADDNIPQNTQGDQYLSCTITPTSATNNLLIMADVMASNSSNVEEIIALFQDTTANALAASSCLVGNGGAFPARMTLTHKMTSGTTSATTFKIRIGGTSGTTTINGVAGTTRRFGGVAESSLTILEIKT